MTTALLVLVALLLAVNVLLTACLVGGAYRIAQALQVPLDGPTAPPPARPRFGVYGDDVTYRRGGEG